MTKIQNLLANPVFDESWVVNLLVQIRKTIELDRRTEPRSWSVVNLFCTWALHDDLSRDKFTIGLFFRAFDVRDEMDLEQFFASDYFKSFVTLDKFRRELTAFLGEHNLPTWLVEQTDDWLRFVYLYAGAVADTPITNSSKGILPESLQELRLDRLSDGSGLDYVRTRARLENGQDYFSMHQIPLLGETPASVFSYLRSRYPDCEQ